jgi:DNA-binding protein Fis
MMTHGLSSNQTRALLMQGVERGRVRQTGRGLYRLARRP